jgi:hypothetical protein
MRVDKVSNKVVPRIIGNIILYIRMSSKEVVMEEVVGEGYVLFVGDGFIDC